MRSPTFTNSGTCTTAPVSSVAGFVTFETVSPRTPGSVSTTASSTAAGSCTPPGRPSTVSICTELDGCRNSSASATEERGSGNCSNVSSSMKTTSSPESYRYWTFFTSVWTRVNFSPARNVRSTTAPLSRLLSFVRTNAPPLPGLTCWNSTIRQTPPSSSMCMPFLNWLVLTISATARGERSRGLRDVDQVLRERGQDLGAVVRHDHEVLDPDAALPREVDARLHADDVSRLQRVLALRSQHGRLVDHQAHAVAEPMAERARELAGVDPVPRHTVDIAAVRARVDGLERRELRLEADRVRIAERRGERTRRERARAVRAVAVDRAARIDDDRLAGLDRALARICVGRGARRPGGDHDGEGQAVGALLVHQLLHPPCKLALGTADEALAGETLERAIAGRGRAPHRVQLGVVLHGAQAEDHARRRHELGATGTESLVAGVRHRVRFERDPSREQLAERAEEVARGLDDLDAVQGARLLGVTKVREQAHAVLLDEQRRVRAPECGEVADVDGVGDEERLVHERAEAVDASVHDVRRSARNSSASR